MLQWLTRALQSFTWYGRYRDQKLMCDLDAGMFDDALDASAGHVVPAAAEQYADAKPFDADAWPPSRTFTQPGCDEKG